MKRLAFLAAAAVLVAAPALAQQGFAPKTQPGSPAAGSRASPSSAQPGTARAAPETKMKAKKSKKKSG
jgi:uncharacterized protein YdeI (BOF family)